MAIEMCKGLALGVAGLIVAASSADAQQVIERDTRLTGPRGRTIERDIRVERGPGYIDRRVEIKRPGETLIRDTRIQAGNRPFVGGGGPGFYPEPRYHGRPIVEEVIVQRPPVFAGFLGLPALNLFFGNTPPPPVVVVPEPVYVSPPVIAYPPIQPPPPVVVQAPPVVVQAPPPLPPDPLADALGRLKSHHGNSRRDGALTLGRIGDDRAVGPLIDRVEHDGEKDVRVAACWALGEIGDERSALTLERASLYDKRHEVREAAAIAYRKLPRPGQAPVPTQAQTQGPVIRSRPEVLDPGPSENPPPPPMPSNGPALEPPQAFRNPS